MPRIKRTPGTELRNCAAAKGFRRRRSVGLQGLETRLFQITKPTIACRISTLRKKLPQRLKHRQNISFRDAEKKAFTNAENQEIL